MNNLPQSVLIIAPYTKRFGAAVFRNSELIYFAVKPFRSRRTGLTAKSEISVQVQNLIRDFRPTNILLKKFNEGQSGAHLQLELALAAKRAADVAHIALREVSFDKVKEALCQTRRPTNSDVFTSINVFYPELAKLTRFQNRSEREYYTPLLSAVAIGLAFQTSQ